MVDFTTTMTIYRNRFLGENGYRYLCGYAQAAHGTRGQSNSGVGTGRLDSDDLSERFDLQTLDATASTQARFATGPSVTAIEINQ